MVQAEDLNTRLPQVIVAMVSSDMARAGHPSRVTVLLKVPLAFQTGLKSDSVIMTDNLGIELQLVRRAIGRTRFSSKWSSKARKGSEPEPWGYKPLSRA